MTQRLEHAPEQVLYEQSAFSFYVHSYVVLGGLMESCND